MGYRTNTKTLRNNDKETNKGIHRKRKWRGTGNTGKNFKTGTGWKIEGQIERKFKKQWDTIRTGEN